MIPHIYIYTYTHPYIYIYVIAIYLSIYFAQIYISQKLPGHIKPTSITVGCMIEAWMNPAGCFAQTPRKSSRKSQDDPFCWVNFITTSLVSLIGNHGLDFGKPSPFMGEQFRLVKYYNLPRFLLATVWHFIAVQTGFPLSQLASRDWVKHGQTVIILGEQEIKPYDAIIMFIVVISG